MGTDKILAFDLGTGGCKASLYDLTGLCLGSDFRAYSTRYPRPGYHEQKPEDWWDAVVRSSRALVGSGLCDPDSVKGIGLSGFSLGMVPIGEDGRSLLEWVPIWSDARPETGDLEPFFREVPEDEWYSITGNGFPPALYTVFKILWFRRELAKEFSRARTILGSKDYINLRLTGVPATDHSYASGTGIYDLTARAYSDRLLAASGLPRSLFPEVVPSTRILGPLLPEAAAALGVGRDAMVVAGGVDNSCMALGARNLEEGSVYNSLGSSSWIAVTSRRPLLDRTYRPYVFEHVVPGMYNSATAIFSAGTSHSWVLRELCRDLADPADPGAIYERTEALAREVPPGSRGLLFNPSLAGGSSLDPSPRIRGAFLGLTLEHTRADLVRATLEGICLGLRVALDVLASLTTVQDEMILAGGGAKSPLWRQMLSDVLGKRVLKTSVDQQAAALGAAAVAAVGIGAWKDFSRIRDLHEVQARHEPDPSVSGIYAGILPGFREASRYLSGYGDSLGSRP